MNDRTLHSPFTPSLLTAYSNERLFQATWNENTSPEPKIVTPRRKIVSGQKSATLDLHSLMLQRFVRDNVNKRYLLCDRLAAIVRNIEDIRVKLATFASTREHEKFNNYVADIEKVTCLMYNLASRLAKVENIIEVFGQDDFQTTRKRDRLKSQLEEAKYLNSLVSGRSKKVLTILEKYFGEVTAADFKEAIDEKLKIILELKELDDKVYLSSA